MEAKHTSGPWELLSEDLRGGRYWSVHRPLDNCDTIDIHEDDNGEADARLISAAPDLLEALIAVTCAPNEMNLARGRAAIAKASAS